MLLTLAVFILILGVLVLSHEFGHFWLAKKAGLKVNEFAFGFPPKLISKTYKGTKYSLNLIPIGGYVKIHGENGEDKNNSQSFSSQSIKVRAGILIAGSLMNIFLGVLLVGLVEAGNIIWLIFSGLFFMLQTLWQSGALPQDIFGPVGIASLTGDFLQRGFWDLLWFVSVLSINLGIINLLPFPALDGGRLLMLVIEKVKGRALNQKVEQLIHATGFALLILLMIFITWQDIIRVF